MYTIKSICHSPYFWIQYKCNVQIRASIQGIKYLYKYMYKGFIDCET
jgi:hypothetical protein